MACLADESLVLGNIHSHNSMTAYFSKVDKDTLLELAPDENFYISTVWATNPTKPFAGALSYLDQYKFPHIYEFNKETTAIDKPEPNEEWDAQLIQIIEWKKQEEEAKKKASKPKGQTEMAIVKAGEAKSLEDYKFSGSEDEPFPDTPSGVYSMSNEDYEEHLILFFRSGDLSEEEFADELAGMGYEANEIRKKVRSARQ
jgi:hypothetical protein